jgi:hypothetical protein
MKRVGELVGAFTLVGGLTWVLLNLHGPHQALDVAVGTVLVLAGLVLLMPHRIRLPGTLTTGVVALAALVGTGAGLAAGAASACCTFAYLVQRGWPFKWLSRGGLADDAATARRLADSAGWHVDAISLAADLLVFAYAGMVIVAVAVLIRRTAADRDARRVEGAARRALTDDRVVGPVP